MSNEMTAQEEQYWLHSLSGDPLIGSFLRTQGMFGDWRQRALRQPLCPKCERLSFHSEHGVTCPTCGYSGSAQKIRIKDHLKNGGYK